MNTFHIPFRCADLAVTLTAFLPGKENSPAIVILPGGGYQICAGPEGAPIAERFAAMGYAAFVLNYSTRFSGKGHTVFPEPLREAAEALKHLRENAAAYGLDPDRITLMGASAGGHLAACYCSSWNTPEVYDGIADPEMLRPNACVLLYAVTAFTQESMMLPAMFGRGGPYTVQELERYTVKNLLGAHTPPTVLFHSAPDPSVPMEQSVRFFSALREKGIPAELHIFGSGEHAYGLGTGTAAEVWPALADTFLNTVFSAPEAFNTETAQKMREARHRKD